MHELTIAKRIAEQATALGDFRGIALKVGELAEITPEELKNALEQLTGWSVTTELVEAAVECGCGYTGKPKITAREHGAVMFECPECTQVPDVILGDEIEIKEVTQ